VKLRGQFISSYSKDFKISKDIDFVSLLMQKLSSYPAGTYLRDPLCNQENKQPIDNSYMTINRVALFYGSKPMSGMSCRRDYPRRSKSEQSCPIPSIPIIW
jgi:hypothetical protein